jgi:hypothetical protein
MAQAVAQQQAAAGGSAFTHNHDRGGDRRLQDGEPAEHGGLGQQVRRRRHSDRLFSLEDGAFADQVADRQRGSHEGGGGQQQVEYLHGFIGSARVRGRNVKPAGAGHG